MFGQVLVMRLFRDKGMLTQICGNNFMVLKIAPALTLRPEQAEEFVDALGEVVGLMHSGGTFWSEPLIMVRRVIKLNRSEGLGWRLCQSARRRLARKRSRIVGRYGFHQSVRP
jgi:hypothetical protein